MKPKISVLVDGVVFENQYQIGVWRVFYELMSRTSSDIQYTLLLNSDAKQTVPSGVRVIESKVGSKPIRKKHWLRRIRKERFAKRISNEFRDAIWHSSFFTPDPRDVNRSVVTVYDMISERFVMAQPNLQKQSEQKLQTLSNAKKIICISESTASDLRKFVPEKHSDVVVASLGCEHLTSSLTVKRQSDNHYCLFVGSRIGYKNFEVLARAAASEDWPSGMEIRVIGKPLSDEEKRLLRYFGADHRFKDLGYLSDEDLSAQYFNASCLVFPSLGEGFGLPTLEAQKNGCIPVVSDLAIFREVAQSGAIYFDPHSPGDLVNAVQQAANPSQREALLKACQSNVDRFSWDTMATKVVEVYQSVHTKAA